MSGTNQFGLPTNLWSEHPSERLKAAQTVDERSAKEFLSALSQSAPMKPWPYGMPTSPNPYVLIIGASPGGSPPAGERIEPYALPKFGKSHPKLYVPDTKGYWDKARDLCVSILQAIDPNIDSQQALSLSGQLNLGAEQSGTAETDPRYVNWVPEAITSFLRPRVIILVGLLGILKEDGGTIGNRFSDIAGLDINWRKPDEDIPFRAYTYNSFKFSMWHAQRNNSKFTFVSWPNHPSRSPMNSPKYWTHAIEEGSECIRNAVRSTTWAASQLDISPGTESL